MIKIISKKQYGEMVREIKNLEGSLNRERKINSDYKKEMQEQIHYKSQLIEKNQKLENKIVSLNKLLHAAHEELKSQFGKNGGLKKFNNKLSEENKMLLKKHREYTKQIEILNQSNSELYNELVAVNEQLDKANKNVEVLEKANNNYKEQLKKNHIEQTPKEYLTRQPKRRKKEVA